MMLSYNKKIFIEYNGDRMNTVSYLDNIASYIKEKESWYLKRFGYAACELWFCVEACNILNFDHPLYSFEKTGSGKFCFNEDDRRDITVYNKDQTIDSHIEVKLLYPSYATSKTNKKINEVFDKFDTYKIKGNEIREGWFILIWSSSNRGKYKESESDKFFYDAIENIKNRNINNSISEYSILSILDNSFKWRSYDKEIIVKATKIIF